MESTKKVFTEYGEHCSGARDYDHVHPVCITGKKFEELIGRNRWTSSDTYLIEDLGFEVVKFSRWIGLTEWDEETFVYRNWLIKKVERHDDGWVVYSPSTQAESSDLDDYTAVDYYDTLEDAVRTIDLFKGCAYNKPNFIK